MRALCYLFLCFFVLSAAAQNPALKINGIVTHDGNPLHNVGINFKGTTQGVSTNEKGAFVIHGNPSDILVFSHLGMKTVEVVLEDITTILNINMVRKEVQLDEVVVKKKRPFTQKELLIAYPKNKGLIKTSRGILDKDRASFSIRIIDGKELIPVGTDFLYSLQNLYPQMEVIRDCLPSEIICPKVILQKWSSGARPTAIFDVDGFIYERPPTFLSAHDIDRAAILVRNGAISRYGSQGAGGVIIINTKSKAWMDDIAIKRTYDNTALRDSLFSVINQPEVYVPIVPEYIKAYKNVISVPEAYEIFKDQRIEYEDFPYYFLEVSRYFWNRWDDNIKSKELLEYMGNRFSKDISAQKALAYSYEEQGRFDNALKTYLTILNLDSRAGQSHRDVANTYHELGNYGRALTVYSRYEHAINELDSIAFDANGADILISTESSNIIKLYGKQLSIKNSLIKEVITTSTTRLVFEWSNNQAEFELQFVGSDDNTFGWKKTKNETDILSQNQKQKGYTAKQFFLEDTLDAEWKVNINYLGNQSDTPTYLKATLYFDYDKPSQRKALKVFRLLKEDVNIHLLTIDLDTKSAGS